MKNYRYLLTHYLPVAVYLGVIVFFSSQTTDSTAIQRFPIPLVWGHFLGYGGLSLLVYRSFNTSLWIWNQKSAGFTITFCVLYAVLDEYYQTHIPTRTGSIMDVVVNVSGVLFILILIWFFNTLLVTSEVRVKSRNDGTGK